MKPHQEQLLPESWCSGAEMLAKAHGPAAPFRSCLMEIKQNCIRKGVAEKILSETEIFIGRGKEKKSVVQKEALTPRMLICPSLQDPRGT